MESESTGGAIAILAAFLSITFFVPILLFALSQKLLSYPFKLNEAGLGRMLWSGVLSFAVSFGLPVGLSLFPVLGTIVGLFLVLPVGAYVMMSLHGLSYWPAFFFSLSSYVVYMLLWLVIVYGMVALLGGVGEALELINEYIDLESIVQKLLALFDTGRSSKGL